MKPSAELQQVIYELTDYITDLGTDVYVKREHFIYEDEDANITVYPPLAWSEEQCSMLQDQISERIADILVETGYLILVYVCTPDQQVQETQRELTKLQKQTEAAQKKLAQAAQLGLLQPEPAPADLVPA